MVKKILLDNKEFHLTKSSLPTLIHGEEHTGASLFTISMFADLYMQGMKVVALTGYPMAIEEFGKQVGSSENVHFFTKEKTGEFVDFVQSSTDIDNHVVLIKNIEFYGEEIFNTVQNFKHLIVSGDVNKCSFKNILLQHSFTTKIYFSPLDAPLSDLQKYEGLLVSEKHHGVVTIEV